MKQNICYFYKKTFIILFCFKIKEKYVKELTKQQHMHLSIEYKTTKNAK